MGEPAAKRTAQVRTACGWRQQLARIASRSEGLEKSAEDCMCERVSELLYTDEDGTGTAAAVAVTSASPRPTVVEGSSSFRCTSLKAT